MGDDSEEPEGCISKAVLKEAKDIAVFGADSSVLAGSEIDEGKHDCGFLAASATTKGFLTSLATLMITSKFKASSTFGSE